MRHALRLLAGVGANAFAVCGDLGGIQVLEELARVARGSNGRAASPVWFVWGNTDDASPLLMSRAQALGLTPPAEIPLRVELSGRRIAVFHGHEPQLAQLVHRVRSGHAAAQTPGEVDYVLYGHTHAPRNERIGSVRFINPGALYRAHIRSVATLDLAHDLVRFWQVSGDEGESESAPVELPW